MSCIPVVKIFFVFFWIYAYLFLNENLHFAKGSCETYHLVWDPLLQSLRGESRKHLSEQGERDLWINVTLRFCFQWKDRTVSG